MTRKWPDNHKTSDLLKGGFAEFVDPLSHGIGIATSISPACRALRFRPEDFEYLYTLAKCGESSVLTYSTLLELEWFMNFVICATLAYEVTKYKLAHVDQILLCRCKD